ncbi:hypothetical protein FM076_07255 [Streptomyces albus subsp. chlorinus]|uniref:hypothetical protein n=1 Tax=Streptomyces albus TaxID=1888 RepID=UPI00156E8726|nr:hypothetical protein [Streptomyces albus]NSC21018.1 hypothetical protein [Streptomyces albus subsp. chlorinus]
MPGRRLRRRAGRFHRRRTRRRAAALYAELARGEELSPAEPRRLDFLQRENGDDPAYARTLLAALGPEGTTRLAHRLTPPGGHGGDSPVLGRPERGLPTSLATATAVPVFRDGTGRRLAFGSAGYRLRPAPGRMIAEYPGDVRRAMYRDDLPVTGAPAGFGAAELHAFLGAVARDPHAYGAIAASQHACSAEHLQSVLHGLSAPTSSTPTGRSFGSRWGGWFRWLWGRWRRGCRVRGWG